MSITLKSVRSYYPHLTIIAILLLVNIILTASKPSTQSSTIPVVDSINTYDDWTLERMRDYQIEIDDDRYIIWDKERLVDVIPYSSTCRFDKMIDRDEMSQRFKH